MANAWSFFSNFNKAKNIWSWPRGHSRNVGNNMKKGIFHIIILLILTSCNDQPEKVVIESTESIQTEKIDSVVNYRPDGTMEFKVKTKNGLKNGNGYYFDSNGYVIGFKHFENDSVNGYGLILNENTLRPKYLYESNNGKRDGVIIEFYENGVIKKFRSADIFNDSQTIRFHENGTIKQIGQTKTGRGHGTIYYFDENGKLEKTVEYENGNVKK